MFDVKLFDVEQLNSDWKRRLLLRKDGIGRQLQMLGRLLHRYMENSNVKKQMDRLTGANCWIVGYISEHDEKGIDVYQKDLERDLKITRSTASKVVKLMEQKELIRRETVANDARLKKLVLTDRAKEVHGKMVKELEKQEEILTTGFTEEELEILRGYIQRMQQNIEKSIHQIEEELHDAND